MRSKNQRLSNQLKEREEELEDLKVKHANMKSESRANDKQRREVTPPLAVHRHRLELSSPARRFVTQ